MAVEYRDVVGFPGYRVGDDGSIWSRWTRKGVNLKKGERAVLGDEWRLLRPAWNRQGYVIVTLHRDGKQISQRVHRLVLIAFKGPPPTPDHVAAHNNDFHSDNRLVNLRWATVYENAQDKKRNGTSGGGEMNAHSKLTTQAVLEIRAAAARGVRNKELAEKYDVTSATVSKVVLGQSWRHLL